MTRLALVLTWILVCFLVGWNAEPATVYRALNGGTTFPGATPTPTPSPSPSPTPSPTPTPTPTPSPNPNEFYFSPTGTDSAVGVITNTCTNAVPCKTSTKAAELIKAHGGGTDIKLKDGTWTYPATPQWKFDCSVGGNAASGTASNYITIESVNERQAFIQGNGTKHVFDVENCSYWNIVGLHVESADKSGVGNLGAVMYIYGPSHISIRRNLLARVNRYANAHALMVINATYAIIEENEAYFFHRWGIYAEGTPTTSATIRRNYVNSRHYSDLKCYRPTGSQCGTPSACYCTDFWNTDYRTMGAAEGETAVCAGQTKGATCSYKGSQYTDIGDEGIGFYYANTSWMENNVSEDSGDGFNQQNTGTGNRYVGNIAMNNREGFRASPGGLNQHPENMIWTNNIAFDTGVGFDIKTQTNATLTYNTVLSNTASTAFSLSLGGNTSPPTTAFVDNCFASTNSKALGYIAATMDNWHFDWSVSYLNTSSGYSPYPSHVNNPVTLTPDSNFYNRATGNGCIVYLAESNLHNACNGTNCGAEIIYRYTGDAPTLPSLTSTPLWDTSTGKFPCGATVAGLNDDVNGNTWDKRSCINVHRRINIGVSGTGAVNGCLLPY